MNKTKPRTKAITSLRLAQNLIRKGHDLAYAKPSHNGFSVVFIFHDSPELRREIKQYYRERDERLKNLNKSGHSSRGGDK